MTAQLNHKVKSLASEYTKDAITSGVATFWEFWVSLGGSHIRFEGMATPSGETFLFFRRECVLKISPEGSLTWSTEEVQIINHLTNYRSDIR